MWQLLGTSSATSSPLSSLAACESEVRRGVRRRALPAAPSSPARAPSPPSSSAGTRPEPPFAAACFSRSAAAWTTPLRTRGAEGSSRCPEQGTPQQRRCRLGRDHCSPPSPSPSPLPLPPPSLPRAARLLQVVGALDQKLHLLLEEGVGVQLEPAEVGRVGVDAALVLQLEQQC